MPSQLGAPHALELAPVAQSADVMTPRLICIQAARLESTAARTSQRSHRRPVGTLWMILASCLALLIALAPACVVSQTITSVTLVSFNPQYPRVDELYRCDIVMNPVATGSYTFTYEWLLQLPLPSTQDAFVYPGGSSATLPSDLKSITSTMAPYKHMRLSCRVTARTASTNALIGTTTSAVTTLVNSYPTITSAEVDYKSPPRSGSGHNNDWARVIDTLACMARNPSDIDDPPTFVADAFYGFFMNFTWSINSVPLTGNTSGTGPSQLSLGTAALSSYRSINATLTPGQVKRGDSVSCTIAPWDSQDWGPLRQSASVVIGVTPPIASGVAMVAADTGLPLRANDSALCDASSVTSPDNDPESAWIYTYGFSWRGKSISNSSQPILASPGWVRGDAASCFVRVDVNVSGTVWRGDEVYSVITVANSPPVTGEAVITPVLPTVLSNLTCSPVLATITDADGDNSTRFTFRYLWTRNGVNISGLDSSQSVLPTTAGNRKGDVIGCSVSTSDGMDFGDWSPEDTVTIVNSPPTLSNATLSFDDPSAPTSITCTPGLFHDPDGDALDGYNVTWFINEVQQNSSVAPLYAAQTLHAADATYTLGSGQRIRCSMRAIAQGSPSAWVTSASTLLDAPSLVQFRAYSLDNKVHVYANGVKLQLTWSAATNLGLLRGTVYAPGANGQSGAMMSKAVIDSLFTFSHNLGLDYTGVWTSALSVLITVSDVRQATPPRIGSTTVSVKSSARVGFNASTSLISISTSPPLTGNFGTAPLGYVWGVLSGVDGETVSVPTLFNLSTVGETMIGASAGVSHAFLITSDRTYGVGSNAGGQLGLIDTSIQSGLGFVSTPSPIDSLANRSIVAMASGRVHSVALSDAGVVFVAGSNGFGQCGLGLLGQSAGSSSGGFQELTLSPFTGGVYASSAGYNSSNPLWSDVVAGYDFSIVYRTAPSRTAEPSSFIYVFGKHFSGAAGYVSGSSNPTPSRLTLPARVVSVAAGTEHVLFLTEGGQVYVWGRNVEGQLGLGSSVLSVSTPTLLTVVPGSSVSVVSIYAGALHSFVVSNTSVVYCFGRNNDGQCGMSPQSRELFLPTVLPVSLFNSTYASSLTAGERASWYTNFDGSVWAMGSNENYALGIGVAQGETMLAPPTYVAPLAAANIAQVYNRKAISVALTPARASACGRGCNNHGSCFNQQCQCTPQWTGVECEIPVCASTSGGVCGGHGNCTIVNDVPTCACNPGFAGSSCLAPDCATSALLSCSSHGTCVFQSASVLVAQCSCNVGWRAPNCATCDQGWSGPNCDVLDCSAWNSCSGSQGTCSQVGRLGACVCASGWTGLSCNQPYCTGLPVCSGHGSCISSGGVSLCACDDRFTGTECQTATCAGSPVCNGQGTCDTSGSSPRCVCNSGFLALDCSIPSCAGALNNCNDHGVCVTSNGAPSCACDSNYSGADCSDHKSITSGVIIALIVVAVLVVAILAMAFLCFLYRRAANSHPLAGAQKSSFFDPIAPKTVRRSNRVSTAPFGGI